ncbi:ATP-dependent RNA helicase DRS1 [Termitomyces sp. T112]|nr:hypothetical protein C0989_008380 [Termitomyces sp. Mn162]KAG5722499.1 ATP-dependent RNA helicase DRS1 [Termitomyces sp. T112]KAH0590712.1 hypothetical protein H2248_000839 [Termitomyces sp. 'cryptogamus']
MPKSTATASAAAHGQQATDEQTSRMSDVALRKKKNADAQAAFRARRANYIATLEETVTSLESVVIQLQESCREARHENQELRQDNARLRHEFREREKFWRNLFQARKTEQGAADCDEPPPLPSSFLSSHPSSNMAATSMTQYSAGGSSYRMSEDVSICHSPYANYSHHTPALSYPGIESDIPSESLANAGHRGSKYNSFSYISGITREASWPSPLTQTASSGVESGTHSSQSSNFIGSPTLTSTDMSFSGRFPPAEDQKVPLSTLDAAPYAFPNSRSISPSASTPSSSSTALTSFQFTFPDNGGQERSDHDYRRHSHSHGAEVTLHGGTADVSLVGPANNDAVRYRLAGRRDLVSSERTLLPTLPPMSGSENEHGSSDGDASYPHTRSGVRRRLSHSRSRSPSPAPPVLSGTLAVIKAQAFGALRRTRARTKRSSEGAAKVAMNVLEARGLGMAPSPIASAPNLKRQRLDDEVDLS